MNRIHFSAAPVETNSHPDALKNKEYFHRFVERPLIWERIQKIEKRELGRLQDWMIQYGCDPISSGSRCYYFTGTNPNPKGQYQELTAVVFRWKDDKMRQYENPISLHQDHAKFCAELNRFFGIK